MAVLAALAAVAMLPGTVGVASAESAYPRYRTADGATAIRGAASTADAPQLEPGLHTDSIKRGEQKYYAVTLDARTSAYFSAVAAPKPGTKVEDYGDKLTISVQDSDGTTCGTGASPSFNGGGMAYPIADYATRRIGADRTECQKAGPYYLVITREGSATSGPDTWPLETELPRRAPAQGQHPRPAGPGQLEHRPRRHRAPDATKRSAKGGTGFNDAGSVDTGVWKDRITAGRDPLLPGAGGLGTAAQPERGAAERVGSGASGVRHQGARAGRLQPGARCGRRRSFVPYTGKPAAGASSSPRPSTTATASTGRLGQRDAVRGLVLPRGEPAPRCREVLPQGRGAHPPGGCPWRRRGRGPATPDADRRLLRHARGPGDGARRARPRRRRRRAAP